MEDNVADALKMAAAVLVFVVALTLAISSFSEARMTAQTILDYSDREYDYTYVEESGSEQRTVGAESIIPVIYRSFKENYKIYFYKDDARTQPMTLYSKTKNDGTTQEINFIDLKRDDIVVFGNDKEREDFLMALLFGDDINATKYGKSFSQIAETFRKNSKITLNSEGLYDKINSERNGFVEHIGEYYQEDERFDSSQLDETSETPDSNKTTKRVYTYIAQ